MTKSPTDNDAMYAEHREYLWGIAYRMLGTRADADEIVQETFVRLLVSAPDRDRPLRPWLTRVSVNLARDRLRRRKRETYVGPWLPAVIAAVEEEGPTGGRYTSVESLSMGFLWAAEQLDDVGRAVLVLRDVFGHSVRETAELLELSETNVKVITHRVRARMRRWEQTQRRRLAVPHERVIDTMRRFFAAIAVGDRDGAEAMLASDVKVLSDGGGEFFAARKPVVGAARVAGFYLKLGRRDVGTTEFELRTLGGVPTLVLRRPEAGPDEAPLVCIQVQLDDTGRIVQIFTVLAPAKVRDMLGG